MIDVKRPVKLRNPKKEEELLVFKITNYNKDTQKCVIEPTNYDFAHTHGELVSITDIENI
jgi:hypothetical protein